MLYSPVYQRLGKDVKKLLWVSLLLTFVTMGCDHFPADPKHSFKEAQTAGLKVGLVVNAPYVVRDGSGYSGTEVQLIETFARRYGLDTEFISATESELIKQLEKYELHIVAGGFEKSTIWMSKAGLSTTYDKKHVFLVPKGENRLLYKLEKIIMGDR